MSVNSERGDRIVYQLFYRVYNFFPPIPEGGETIGYCFLLTYDACVITMDATARLVNAFIVGNM